MIQYNKGPSVINTSPRAHETHASTDSAISISFDKEISQASVQGHTHLVNRNGESIECVTTYRNKQITLRPMQPLSPNTSYTVIINGDNDPLGTTGKKGILSPTGIPMLGDYTFTFTTTANVVEQYDWVSLSPHNIILDEQPRLLGTLTVDIEEDVTVELSSSNTFEQSLILWEVTLPYALFKKGLKPLVELYDGLYYWRVKAANGRYSDTLQFAIEKIPNTTVLPSDPIESDIAFPEDWSMLPPSVIDLYPQDEKSHVKPNLKTINLTFNQIIPTEALNQYVFELKGEAVDESLDSLSHGVVDCDLSVIYDHEQQTTTIIAVLPELSEVTT